MNITIHYGTGVAAVPKDVLRVMDRATLTDLRLLILLSADPAYVAGSSLAEVTERLSGCLGCTPVQIETSLAFWRGAGVLDVQGEELSRDAASSVSAEETTPPARQGGEPSPVHPTVTVKRPTPEAALPRYTSEELADLLESREEARNFINECSRIWGKLFNVAEVNMLLSLVDYLGLDWDYVVTLLAFCARTLDMEERKHSMRFVEKTAYAFYDEGILDLTALQEKLRRLESSREAEGRLRRMLGIGDRELTSTEKKHFSKWLYDFGYDLEIITKAYEVTVEAKGRYDLRYMNAVLSNWNKEGLRTLEEISASNEKYRAEHPPADARKGSKTSANPTVQSSFDTDDFFYDAVRRSLGDDIDINELKKNDGKGDT